MIWTILGGLGAAIGVLLASRSFAALTFRRHQVSLVGRTVSVAWFGALVATSATLLAASTTHSLWVGAVLVCALAGALSNAAVRGPSGLEWYDALRYAGQGLWIAVFGSGGMAAGLGLWTLESESDLAWMCFHGILVVFALLMLPATWKRTITGEADGDYVLWWFFFIFSGFYVVYISVIAAEGSQGWWQELELETFLVIYSVRAIPMGAFLHVRSAVTPTMKRSLRLLAYGWYSLAAISVGLLLISTVDAVQHLAHQVLFSGITIWIELPLLALGTFVLWRARRSGHDSETQANR